MMFTQNLILMKLLMSAFISASNEVGKINCTGKTYDITIFCIYINRI
jgi:hypothetical protein